MKQSLIIFSLILCSIGAYAQPYAGGAGGGYAKANLIVTLNTKDMENSLQKALSVFPNPVRSGSSFQVLGLDDIVSFIVVDLLGTMHARYTGIPAGSAHDLPSLPSGIYYLMPEDYNRSPVKLLVID